MKKVLVLSESALGGEGSVLKEIKCSLLKYRKTYRVIDIKPIESVFEKFHDKIEKGVEIPEITKFMEEYFQNQKDDVIILKDFPKTVAQAVYLKKTKGLDITVLEIGKSTDIGLKTLTKENIEHHIWAPVMPTKETILDFISEIIAQKK